ncbi:hypothetical protein F2Q69_00039250 [Brassica cretica]|uniref:Transmembrane protein n=1 Tax=Brassica cretica TaxID=69181 RepID=A0A8S9SQV3_BRACR|nr:hypothetical protein F2Q69_00039250 [Brassica cretica]
MKKEKRYQAVVRCLLSLPTRFPRPICFHSSPTPEEPELAGVRTIRLIPVLLFWFCFASAAGLTDLCRCRLLWVLLLICSPLPAFSVVPSSAFRKAPNLRFRFHRLPRCSHHHEQTWQTP